MDHTPAARPNPEELTAAMALCLAAGIGPRLQAALLERFGTAGCILKQPVSELLTVSGIGPRAASQLTADDLCLRAEQMVQRCRESSITLLRKGQPEYPSGLQSVEDSPAMLFVRGKLKPQDELTVAVVGSRRCTAYGRRQAERLGASLSRAGFTVVSGLARGIDGAAHAGALAAGGRTVAVLGTGLNEIYPPEHAELAMEIADNGALVSEFPLDQKPRSGLFPQRNRIISGLSLAVVIVEATRNSGALHTARHAAEQGRTVFAVPGPVDSIASEGCHELLRDGAVLLRNVDDLLKDLGPLAAPTVTAESDLIHNPRELSLNVQEKEVLNLITSSPVHIDAILQTTQLDMSRVLSTLTVLEMKRFVRRLPGNRLVRNS